MLTVVGGVPDATVVLALPVTLDVAVSVAEMVCAPKVLNVAANVCVP